MSDCMEKIYCCDRDNDNALAAAILANGRNNDYGMNGWMNNPFAYLMFLALFRNGGFGFGDWNGNGAGVATQGIETQAQLNAIRTQLQDNQNADCIKSAIQGNGFALSKLAQTLNIDYNALQKCCCDVQAAIQQVSGQVGFSAEKVINAVNMGDCNVIQAIKDCCCTTQKEILTQGYQNQLAICGQTRELRDGQRDLGVAISEGFAKVGYQQAADKCEIIRAGQDNTQRIIDTLNNHWSNEQAREIQDLKAKLSQVEQTDVLTQRFYRMQNGCGCGNGCGNGVGY